jgi:hypothetical protein
MENGGALAKALEPVMKSPRNEKPVPGAFPLAAPKVRGIATPFSKRRTRSSQPAGSIQKSATGTPRSETPTSLHKSVSEKPKKRRKGVQTGRTFPPLCPAKRPLSEIDFQETKTKKRTKRSHKDGAERDRMAGAKRESEEAGHQYRTDGGIKRYRTKFIQDGDPPIEYEERSGDGW